MRTAGQIYGLAVVIEGTGDRVGRIQDVLFEPSGQVSAFLIHPGGLLAKPQILPRLFVRTLGDDALLIEGGRVLEDAARDPAVENSIHARGLDNRPILDDAGKVIGKVDDIVLDEPNLAVTALVVGTSTFNAMLHGKPRIPFAMVKTIGKDSVVIPATFDLQTAERSR